MLVRLVLSAALLCVSAAQPSSPEDLPWELVAGRGGGVAGRTWEQIVGFYPRGLFRAVVASGDASGAASNRFVVGAPVAHPLLAELAPSLGLEVGTDALTWRGRTIPRGTGLALVVPDPDGQGLLAVFTGVDDESVWQCFTIPFDLTRRGVAIARQGDVLAREAALVIDASRPSLARLDLDWDRAVAQARAEGRAGDELALRVARALAGQRAAFEAALGARVDLAAHVGARLDADDVAAARRYAAGTDLDARLRALHDRTVAALGEPAGTRPAYAVLYGAAPGRGTNARTYGVDAVTGRPAIVLNLCALADDASFDVAVVHETVHAYQPATSGPRRLVDRAIAEGVAMVVSEELCPEATPADVFMADDTTLTAAEARRAAIDAAFAAVADSTDPAVHAAWLQLDRSPLDVDGAPPRAGYHVGWRAARAWLTAAPDRDLSALLVASPDDVHAALR